MDTLGLKGLPTWPLHEWTVDTLGLKGPPVDTLGLKGPPKWTLDTIQNAPPGHLGGTLGRPVISVEIGSQNGVRVWKKKLI